jgi:O-antigen/teichoic acid export membrane protein
MEEKESNLIASNVIVQTIGRVLVLALALISIKLITNYLGPAGTGNYNTIVTYLSFFITFADFGLFSIGVREISKRPQDSKKILGNIFYIRFVSALAASVIACLIAFNTGYSAEIKYGVAIASIFLFFNLTSSVYDMLFQVRLEMSKVAIAEVISRTLAVLIIVVATQLNLGFYIIVASVSFAAVVNFLIKYLYSRKKLVFGPVYDSETAKWILKLSIPLGIVFVVNNFYFKVDTLILFYFKGAEDVGIYSVAYRILETTIFIAAFLANSLKPLLSRNVISDAGKAARAASRGFTMLFFMSLPIVIASIPFSKEIIIFLSNSEFLGGAPILVILSIASVFIYLNILLGEIMIAKDLRRYLIVVAVLTLTLNIGANIIFIPKYSYTAAAYVTMASELLLFVLGLSKVLTFLPLKFDFWRMAKIGLCAFLAIIIGLGIRSSGLNFAIGVLASFIFYGSSAYLIDAVPKSMISDYFYSVKRKWTN